MLIKDTYKVLGDDWWKVEDGRFVLGTDTLIVANITEEKVFFNVIRNEEVIGELRVHHVFIKEDFEQIVEVD